MAKKPNSAWSTYVRLQTNPARLNFQLARTTVRAKAGVAIFALALAYDLTRRALDNPTVRAQVHTPQGDLTIEHAPSSNKPSSSSS